jgi:hypothetical protein
MFPNVNIGRFERTTKRRTFCTHADGYLFDSQAGRRNPCPRRLRNNAAEATPERHIRDGNNCCAAGASFRLRTRPAPDGTAGRRESHQKLICVSQFRGAVA